MADPKYLGLNIIVGPNEAEELERCLKSCQGDLFDEVVVTTTSKDKKVQDIAEKYATKTPYFEWINDFAAARNYSFSHSSTKHIFWIDADDTIKPGEYKKLLELKKSGKLDSADIALLDYVYYHDQEDKPVVVLPRERIVRNIESIKWYDPIHEYINMDGQRIERYPIRVDHYRTKPYDPNRNLSLLAQEYGKPNCSTRIKFYYGKELADNGDHEKAIPILEDYVNTGKGFIDNLSVACIRLSRYYHAKGDFESAKRFALKGIGFNAMYAEHYVMVGDIYLENNEFDPAIRYYMEALTKELSGGMSQIVDYYGFIPAKKLAIIYCNNRNYEEAKKYIEIALEYKREEGAIELKKMIDREFEKVQRGAVLNEERKDEVLKFLEQKGYGVEVENNNYDYAQIKLTREMPIDIVWLVPAEGSFDPALRIRRLNISQKLGELGYKSKVIKSYNEKNKYDIRNEIGDANVVVFSQFGQYDLDLMKLLKEIGKKIVRDICEALFGFPFQSECFNEADLITCCSSKLEQLTKDQGYNNTVVLKDAIEDRAPKVPLVYENRNDRPKAVFMGGGGNSFLATEVLKTAIEKAGYDLVLITEWDNADIKWDINTWPDDLCSCDVAICPQRVDQQPAKSNVKITTAMGLGLPVVASPLQAYKEIIKNGDNGYICDTAEEWESALTALKDPAKRKQIGEAGKNSVKEYSLDSISKQWVGTLKKLVNGQLVFQETFSKPSTKHVPTLMDAIDIIIPNYQNLEYLKLCVTSIMVNTLHPFNIIISDAGSDKDVWGYLNSIKGVKVLGSPDKRLTFSESCNAGIKESKSKFFVILNSDTVLSKGWLHNLVHKMNTVPRLAACNGLSNCDRGWRFDDPRDPSTQKFSMHLDKSGVELVPGMKMETIKPNIDELYKFMEKSNEDNKDVYKEVDWVASYGTIFARSAIDEIGMYDTQYKNGCEDWDLCHRLSKCGFKMGHAMGSFIFHFGGVSRGAYQNEAREEYDREDRENHSKMKNKWSSPRIGIWTGPAWEPWDKAAVDAGMAGSETWATYLAEAFAKKGFDVRLYNDLKTEDKSKPMYIPVEGAGTSVKYVDYTRTLVDLEYDHLDYFISSRTVSPFNHRLHVGKRYVMVHDIWLNADPNYDIKSWMVSGYAYLSDWHKNFLVKHHKIPTDKLFLTANGVCEENYKDVDSVEKKNQMIYSSSPDRGLYQLLKMVPEIRKEVPDFKLLVSYGFYNWEQAAKSRNDAASMELIGKIKELVNQDGVEYLDRINKVDLAKHQKESKVWIYPSWFTETFCNIPSNRIFTDEGYIPIRDVTLKHKVLTHNNNMRGIVQTMRRPYKGLVHGILTEGNTGSVGYFTPEHPIYALKKEDAHKIKRFSYGDYKKETIDKICPQWIPAKDISKGDYVCVPKQTILDDTIDSLDVMSELKKVDKLYKNIDGRIRYSKRFKGLPAKINLDNDFAYFLGLYFAGGCSSTNTLTFSFHKDEDTLSSLVKDYAERALGLRATIKNNETEKSAIVKLNCKMLGDWFKELFGIKARNKKVPYFLFNTSRKFRIKFLEGVFDGGGNKLSNCVRLKMATEKGIDDIRALLMSLGVFSTSGKPKVSKRKDGRELKYYNLCVPNGQWGKIDNKYTLSVVPETLMSFRDILYSRVLDNLVESYEGDVYNFEVEEDNSYVSNFIAVHNCIGAVENGLSKNAIVTTDLAGLSSTVGSAGVLFSPEGLSRDNDYPQEFCDKFVKTSIRMLKDEEYRKKWADKAYNKMSGQYQWSHIADEWIKKFDS